MLPKAYEPQEVEQKLADKWQNAKLFAAKNDKTKKPFVIVIPPPNITGLSIWDTPQPILYKMF